MLGFRVLGVVGFGVYHWTFSLLGLALGVQVLGI